MVDNKLIVPKERSSWYGNEEDRTARKDFEKEVTFVLSGTLTGEWNKYLFFEWTSEFFVIKVGTEKYNSKKVKSFKKGKDFILKQDVISEIKNEVNLTIKKENDKDEHRSEYDKLKAMSVSAIQVNDSGIKAEVDYRTLDIVVSNNPKEDWSANTVSCLIKRDGTITPPENRWATNVKSIEQAKGFIEQFAEEHQRLSAVAAEIKNKLPKEYFTNG